MEINNCLQCGNIVPGGDCGYVCMTCGYSETWSDITPRTGGSNARSKQRVVKEIKWKNY